MFNLKIAFKKVFGSKATTPRKSAIVITTPAPATPQITLDDARRSLLEVLKAVEEKKLVAKKERRAACEEFFVFLHDAASDNGYEDADCERICSPLGISPEVIDMYFSEGKLPAFAAAVEFFVIIKGDFGTGLDKAFQTIDSSDYTFFTDICDDYDLGEMLARDKIDEDIWDFVDFESLGYAFSRNGNYVFNGFFAPQKF